MYPTRLSRLAQPDQCIAVNPKNSFLHSDQGIGMGGGEKDAQSALSGVLSFFLSRRGETEVRPLHIFRYPHDGRRAPNYASIRTCWRKLAQDASPTTSHSPWIRR